MGDGVTKRVAIIVNGDTEARHLQNVEWAIARFRKDGFDEVHVVSTRQPDLPVTVYADAYHARQALDQVLRGLALDDDDIVDIYITGHGDLRSGAACVVTPSSCLSVSDLAVQLKILPYRHRTIFMDQCYSGQEAHRFVDGKTTLLAIGSPGETVSCQKFTPLFFADAVPDADRDGITSVEERLIHAVKGYDASSVLFYSPDLPSDLAGHTARAPSFANTTVRVNDGTSLAATLRTLKPGQLALVNFSADWCGACKPYEPRFEQLAAEYHGQFLTIQAKGIQGSDQDWARYGVTALPTVAFIDWQGHVFPVGDRNDPRASLHKTIMTPEIYARHLEARYTEQTTAEGKAKVLAQVIDVGPAAHEILKRIGERVFTETDRTLHEAYLTALSDATYRAKGREREVLGRLFWGLAEKYPHAVYVTMEECGALYCRYVGTPDTAEEWDRLSQRAEDRTLPPALRKIAVVWRTSYHGSRYDKANFDLVKNDPDPEVRRAAAKALTIFLGQLQDLVAEAIPIALHDSDPVVRAHLMRGLGEVYLTPEVCRALCLGLTDPDAEVRRFTTERLHGVDFFWRFNPGEKATFDTLFQWYNKETDIFAKVLVAGRLVTAPKTSSDLLDGSDRLEMEGLLRRHAEHPDARIRAEVAASLDDILEPNTHDRQFLVRRIKAEQDPQVKTILFKSAASIIRDTQGIAAQQEFVPLVVEGLRSGHAEVVRSAIMDAFFLRDPPVAVVGEVRRIFYGTKDGEDLRNDCLQFFSEHPRHFTAQMEQELHLLESRYVEGLRMALDILRKGTPQLRAALRTRVQAIADNTELLDELRSAARDVLDRPYHP